MDCMADMLTILIIALEKSREACSIFRFFYFNRYRVNKQHLFEAFQSPTLSNGPIVISYVSLTINISIQLRICTTLAICNESKL